MKAQRIEKILETNDRYSIYNIMSDSKGVKVDNEKVELLYQIECKCFEHYANKQTKQQALELLLKEFNHIQSRPINNTTHNINIYDDILKIVNNVYDMDNLDLDSAIIGIRKYMIKGGVEE